MDCRSASIISTRAAQADHMLLLVSGGATSDYSALEEIMAVEEDEPSEPGDRASEYGSQNKKGFWKLAIKGTGQLSCHGTFHLDARQRAICTRRFGGSCHGWRYCTRQVKPARTDVAHQQRMTH
eukprot:3342430-Amphidinium_carterae.1